MHNASECRAPRFLTIVPGYIETDVTAALRDEPIRNPAILSRIPASRWGQPEDLNGAVVFMASRASDYVNGAILVVEADGWAVDILSSRNLGIDPLNPGFLLEKDKGQRR